jgi:uncharacterized protein with FMN-binding domain
MKRAVLIAGGTVGGLGAVLSITPPQLAANVGLGVTAASAATLTQSTNVSTNNNSQNVVNGNVSTATPSNSAAPVTTNTKKVTKKKKAKSSGATTNSTTSSTTAQNGTSSSTSNVNGSFTGEAVDVSYGIVQVKITVTNGKITDAVALQSPTGRSQRFSDYALPNLRSQTLAAQSAAIQGASGASYTSYGWYKSLISALQKAGMKTGV